MLKRGPLIAHGRRAGARRDEQGQTLVLFIALFSVILGLAAFSIDQGVWLGERRISQKDADTSARGGAMVYLSNTSPSARPTAAAVAELIAGQNLADIAAPLTDFRGLGDCTTYDGTVYPNVPSVEVDINAPTGGLFSSLFGITGIDDLGATATACAGEPEFVSGIDPFEIAPGQAGPDLKCFNPDRTPRLGSVCPIVVPSGYQDTGTRGNLSLQDDPDNDADPGCNPASNSSCETECTEGNANNTDAQVVTSSLAKCRKGDVVYTKQGNLNNVKGAVRCRIQGYDDVGNECPNGLRSASAAPGEGFCDASAAAGGFHIGGTQIPPFASSLTPAFPPGDVIASPNGADDFQEAFSKPPSAGGGPPTSLSGSDTLVPNICANGEQSPRIITIIIAEGPAVNGKIVVYKFATFFILGCWDLAKGKNDTFTGSIDPFCNKITAANTALVGVFVKAFLPAGGGGLVPCPAGNNQCIGQSIVLVK